MYRLHYIPTDGSLTVSFCIVFIVWCCLFIIFYLFLTHIHLHKFHDYIIIAGSKSFTAMEDTVISDQGSSKGNTEASPVDDWTKKEKFELLQCLKAVGSRDFSYINSQIPTKTPEQIELAIDYYKTKAFKNRDPPMKKGGRPRAEVNFKQSVPLTQWAKFLTDNINYNELQTEVATALRLIAEFESIPQALCTEYVDFRKAYHLLANAVEGKDLQDDKFITKLIVKSIVETALASKLFVHNTTVKQIVKRIELETEKDVKTFQRPITNKELRIVLHLAEQKNYNPLNITQDHLKSSRE